MARTRISQREARRLQKRVQELERAALLQRRAWSQEYILGSEIGRTSWSENDAIPVAVRTARKLGHAVVVTGDQSGLIRFIALPHPDVKV